jgi:hypothetical protein
VSAQHVAAARLSPVLEVPEVTEPVSALTPATPSTIELHPSESAPPAAAAPATTSSSSQPSPATLQLMSAHSLLPHPSPVCLDRAADVAKGAGALTAAATALAVSGTAGPVGAFIGASMLFGAVLAQYYNCEVAAAESRAKAPPK